MNETDTEFRSAQYQAEDQTAEEDTSPGNTVGFFPVSEDKLITLYILSFGLYGIYWFYKNWKLQQSKIDKKIFPVLRAIFSIFFTHSLFNRINNCAGNLPQKHRFNANILATIFVGAIIISNIIDPIYLNTSLLEDLPSSGIFITSLIIFLLSVYPLVVVQATVNRINNDMLGYLNHRYSLWNYLLIVLGVLIWLMLAMGLLAQSMGLVPVQ
ncbi:MAG: hypothetical protein IMF15_08720 [Proteobacteria bacterium]|nr:hypothetical protein [Pseudomonadota bacterium]